LRQKTDRTGGVAGGVDYFERRSTESEHLIVGEEMIYGGKFGGSDAGKVLSRKVSLFV